MRVDRVASRPEKVLIVVANPATSTTLGWPVGFWGAELTHPYYELTQRLFRLPADRALVNRMGFNNHGAAAAATRLRARRDRRLTLGVNIGKTKIVPEAEAAGDYTVSARLLANAGLLRSIPRR